METVIDIDSIRTSVDERCKALLDEVQNLIPLKFIRHDKDEYSSQPHKNGSGEITSATLWYHEPIESAKIAHELLHVKLSTILKDGGCMLNINSKNPFIRGAINEETVSGIINFTEHIIFYKEFINMGYSISSMFESQNDSNRGILDNLKASGLKKGTMFCPIQVSIFVRLALQYTLYPDDKRFNEERKILMNLQPQLYKIFDDYQKAVRKIRMRKEDNDKLQHAYCTLRNSIIKWYEAYIK